MSTPSRGAPARTADRRWTVAAILLTAVVASLGCNPLTATYFLFAPDQNLPPEYDLTEGKDEPTVLVMAAHAGIETRTELSYIDHEIERAVADALKKRFKDNREKAKVVPTHKVREYKVTHPDWKVASPGDIGKQFEADYVINLEITRISLYEKGSSNTLYSGQAEIYVTLTDITEPDEVAWSKFYVSNFPSTGPEPVDVNVAVFRNRFINHIAWDISRFFLPYPSEDRFRMK